MGLLRLTLLGNRGGQVDQGTDEAARTVSEKEVVSHRAKITTRTRQTTRVKNMINSTVCSENLIYVSVLRTALSVH